MRLNIYVIHWFHCILKIKLIFYGFFMAIPRLCETKRVRSSMDLRHRHSGGGLLTMKHIDSRVNVSPRSERAAHLSGPPALKASSHHERIFVNKIYGRWTVPYRGVLPPIGWRTREITEVSSFILAWNAIKVRRLSRIVLLRFELRSAVLCCGLAFLSSLLLPIFVAVGHYDTTNLIMNTIRGFRHSSELIFHL